MRSNAISGGGQGTRYGRLSLATLINATTPASATNTVPEAFGCVAPAAAAATVRSYVSQGFRS